MDNIKPHIIKTIAEELECGFDCYLNVKTEEIITIPDSSNVYDEDDFKEAFKAEFEKIEQQKTELIKFEALQNIESYKIMLEYSEQISNDQLQEELEDILIKKHPFKNFKNRIDNSDYRQDWFDFKRNQLEMKIENRLKNK